MMRSFYAHQTKLVVPLQHAAAAKLLAHFVTPSHARKPERFPSKSARYVQCVHHRFDIKVLESCIMKYHTGLREEAQLPTVRIPRSERKVITGRATGEIGIAVRRITHVRARIASRVEGTCSASIVEEREPSARSADCLALLTAVRGINSNAIGVTLVGVRKAIDDRHRRREVRD